MPGEDPLSPKGLSRRSVAELTLRQADQARTDFPAIESSLEFSMSQPPELRRGSSWRATPCMVGTECLVQTWQTTP